VGLLPRRLRHGEEATLVEHLGELRARIVVSLVALAVGFVAAYAIHGKILDWLNRPLPKGISKPVTFSPAEPFLTSVKVSLLAGFLLALPIILWQVWGFFAPAIEEHSQRVISLFVGLATVLMVGGVVFGYYIALPAAIGFLTNFDKAHYNIQLRAKDYYSFTTLVLFAMAVVFELPLFVLALVRLRIVTAAQLRRGWRVGIVSVVALGVALPGVDPVTTTVETVPLLILYFLAVGLASFLEPRWRETRETETETAPSAG
jgi:sec-independent protein translocase protein TatC